MKSYLIFGIFLFLIFSVIHAHAQTYKACYGSVVMRKLPNPTAEKTGSISKNETVRVITNKTTWLKVMHEGIEGWVDSKSMCLVTPKKGAVSKPVLTLKLINTERSDDKYRHFFIIYNRTETEFSGGMELWLFKDAKRIFYQAYKFSTRPIPPKGEKSFYVDTVLKMTKYTFKVTKP